jgi:hypothetical protein
MQIASLLDFSQVNLYDADSDCSSQNDTQTPVAHRPHQEEPEDEMTSESLQDRVNQDQSHEASYQDQSSPLYSDESQQESQLYEQSPRYQFVFQQSGVRHSDLQFKPGSLYPQARVPVTDSMLYAYAVMRGNIDMQRYLDFDRLHAALFLKPIGSVKPEFDPQIYLPFYMVFDPSVQ